MTAALPALKDARAEHVFLVTKLVRADAPNILVRDAARDLARYTLIYYRAKYAYRLYGFCFLPERAYLVIAFDNETALAPAMKDVWGEFSRKVKRRWGRNGSLLRSRFLAEPLTDPPSVRRALVYIHDQPILRGLDEPARRAPITSAAAYRRGIGDMLVELYTLHRSPDDHARPLDGATT